MMIIENLLIFLIEPCALTNTNWDFSIFKRTRWQFIKAIIRIDRIFAK